MHITIHNVTVLKLTFVGRDKRQETKNKKQETSLSVKFGRTTVKYMYARNIITRTRIGCIRLYTSQWPLTVFLWNIFLSVAVKCASFPHFHTNIFMSVRKFLKFLKDTKKYTEEK
jgi:hypothetical protein